MISFADCFFREPMKTPNSMLRSRRTLDKMLIYPYVNSAFVSVAGLGFCVFGGRLLFGPNSASPAKIVSFSSVSSISSYTGFLPGTEILSEYNTGTPSPRLSIMNFLLVSGMSKFMGVRASRELISSFREYCPSGRLSSVMVFGHCAGRTDFQSEAY